ncbi:RNA polymerase II transcription factor B subunit 4 [Histomonas meleagridis]|uniref:RNA polymerase II transcription factor B subunit 4 n=1 Tax=Histomonas meleagridis TaxID=135588 RepID=UPI00355ACB0D|nr:RNA polymerase II transcription factor B subunit 4 [Histomonas meleagridis]KAH0802924.1 RNA polymerase II transcription factor B subunit 4 [Histomonas meleagridis]
MNQREVALFLLDTNPIAWKKLEAQGELSFSMCLDQLFAYFNQMILTDIFQIAPVLAYNQAGTEWVAPGPERTEALIRGELQATNSDEIFLYCKEIVSNISGFARQCALNPPEENHGVRLDIALSRALCLLNKFPSEVKKRIIVITPSCDSQSHFESTINAIFAAHRIGVVIDSLIIKSKESLFLNQAALITNGFSLAIEFRTKLLTQYLLSIPPLPVRNLIMLKKVQNINYKTPAENTGNMIDVGLMCPVCLSVFEKTENKLRTCPVCKSRSLV